MKSYNASSHNNMVEFTFRMERMVKAGSFLLLLLLFASLASAQNVNVPDANFKKVLVDNVAINTNNDAEIQVSEAVAYTDRIDVFNKSVTDLTGIEAFENLTALSCSGNALTSLDLSKNTALKRLTLSDIKHLTSLNLRENIALTDLSLIRCPLSQLEINYSALTKLNLFEVEITNLEVPDNNKLTELRLRENSALTNLDISKATTLKEFDLVEHSLTQLDLSKNTNLKSLYLLRNKKLTSLDLSHNIALVDLTLWANSLNNIDISKNIALEELICTGTNFTSLDISANTALTTLELWDNPLTTLDVSKNTALSKLVVKYLELTELDVSKNTALTYLNCEGNQLTNLEISNSTSLTFLGIRNNKIAKLDVSSLVLLEELVCDKNKLTELDLRANTKLKQLYCEDNELVSLDLRNGNNANLSRMYAKNNSLTCIDVDDTSVIGALWKKDDATNYCAPSATNILAYSLPSETKEATINVNAHTVTIEVESDTDVTTLVGTFELSRNATAKVGSIAQVSGTTVNDFSSAVTYTVTAEDGVTTQDWQVTVTVASRVATDITAFSLPEQTGAAVINNKVHTVKVEVERGTNLTALIGTFTLSTGAIAKVGDITQVSSTTANDFTTSVTYTVIAADGKTTQDWEVIVTAAVNTETDITAFTFSSHRGSTIDPYTHTIDIKLVYGTDPSALISKFTLSEGAIAKVEGIIQVSGTTINDFTDPLIYKVIAEDGITTQDWKVTVTVAINEALHILTYSLLEQTKPATINATAYTVDVEVAPGTDLSTFMVATFTLSTGTTAKVGATPQVSGTTANDFSDPVIYKVIEVVGDNITAVREWLVTVTVAPYTATDILTYSVPGQIGSTVIDDISHKVAVEVPYGTDVTTIKSSHTLSQGATAKVGNILQESEVTANDFTNPVTYALTAEDGITTQNWEVDVTIAPNTTTEIIAFGLPEQIGAAKIDAVAHTIDIEVSPSTDVKALIGVFTLSTGATAKVGRITQMSGTTVNDFSSPLTFTILAEDGKTTQDWQVTATAAVVNQVDKLENIIEPFPNPITNLMRINLREYSETKEIKITLIDIRGNLVLDQLIRPDADDIISVDMTPYPSGLYLLKLGLNKKVISRKVLKR